MFVPGRNQENICLVCGNTLEPAASYCGCCGFPAENRSSGHRETHRAVEADAWGVEGHAIAAVNDAVKEGTEQHLEGCQEKRAGEMLTARQPLIQEKLVMVLEYEKETEEESAPVSRSRGLLDLIGAAVGYSPLMRVLFVLLMLASMACGYIVGDRLWADENRKVIYIPRISFKLDQIWPVKKIATLTEKTAAHNEGLSMPAPRLIDKVVVPEEADENLQKDEKEEPSSTSNGSGALNNGVKQVPAEGMNQEEAVKKSPVEEIKNAQKETPLPQEGVNKAEKDAAPNGSSAPKTASAKTRDQTAKPPEPAVTAPDILMLKQAVASAQKNYLLALSTGGGSAAQAEKIYRENTARLGHALYSFYTTGGRNNSEIARQEMRLLMVELWGWGTPGVEREIERAVSTVR